MNSVNPGDKTQQSLRIAIVGRLDHPGGVQSVILSLIHGLNQIGITPDLVWDEVNRKLLIERRVSANFSTHQFLFPSSMLDTLPISFRYILRVFNYFTDRDLQKQYDFYYIFNNGFYVTGNVPHVRYLNGPPLLPQLDMVSPGLKGLPYRFFRLVYRRLLSKWFPVYEYHRDSSYVINSSFTAELFQQAHGVFLPVVHPPINLAGRSFTPGDISSRSTITYFSRFVNYKRPHRVLELAAEHPELNFILMGGLQASQASYYQYLLDQAANNHLDNVLFIPNPDDSKIREVLLNTLIYIFPGENEHFGMTTAESIASGAIPFVHDSGGQREIVPDPILRFNDENISDRFNLLLKLPLSELQEKQTCLANHVKNFSEEVFIQKMLSFIR